MEEPKVCHYCLEEINGGTYIDKVGKQLYFCSWDCLNAYEKEQNNSIC